MDQNLSAVATQQESINTSLSFSATQQRSIDAILSVAAAQQRTIDMILTITTTQQRSIDAILTTAAAAQQQGMDASSSIVAQQESINACLSVARRGNIDELYSLIQRDPDVLERFNKIPFVETPLHAAASEGHIKFALEIMRLKHSFARKLNKEGHPAVYLTLEGNQHLVASKLLKVDKDLLRVQGKEGVTPLHYAAKTGNKNLLAKFLYIDPKYIVDLTFQNESALYIAQKKENFDAFHFLVNWLKRACFKDASFWESTMLNLKDEEGNTLLHIAASKTQYEVVGWLLDCGVDKGAKDVNGQTAFDFLQGQPCGEDLLRRAKPRNRTPVSLGDRLANLKVRLVNLVRLPFQIDQKLYIFFRRVRKQLTDNSRDSLLVVIMLLITVILQATLSPPGGTWQEDYYSPAANSSSSTGKLLHAAGTSIMDARPFTILTEVNALYLLVLIFTLAILLPSVSISSFLVSPLLIGASLSFITSVCVTFLGSKCTRLRNTIVFLSLSVFLWLGFLALGIVRRQRRIDREFLPKEEPLEDQGKHDQELLPQEETA